MTLSVQKLRTFLWFDTEAEAAAQFYTSIFPDARIGRISRYGEEASERHGREPGSVMVVEFEILGMAFAALNGGPQFKFTEAVSFQIGCETQEEVDYYWEKLTDGGEEGHCGWLKDRFGLSWQVVPRALGEMLTSGEPEKAARATGAFMQMRKFDIDKLKSAYEGQ